MARMEVDCNFEKNWNNVLKFCHCLNCLKNYKVTLVCWSLENLLHIFSSCYRRVVYTSKDSKA